MRRAASADFCRYGISLDVDEAASFHQLPRVPHRDLFDRMLVWEALQRKLVLVARDAALPAYAEAGLETLW